MSKPKVSLLIAMRNEEAYIERCLASIRAQDYSAALEVLVYDGLSDDRSREVVTRFSAGWPNCHLRDNPRRIQSAGWNLGIEEASGDIIGIVGAHTELAPDYVTMAVETLDRTGATMVGGPMVAVGKTPVAAAVALATSSPFGVGGARFHYTEREEEVDTVYQGLCRSEDYRRFRFDEEMVRDQDDELSYRILDAGGRIVCNPAIRSSYANRSGFRSLWTQYYQYGYWKVRVMQKHPRQIRLRQLAPPGFVATIFVSILSAPFLVLGRLMFLGVASSYVAANLVASVASSRARLRLLPYMPFTYATLHLAYGLGYLNGLVHFRKGLPFVKGPRSGKE